MPRPDSITSGRGVSQGRRGGLPVPDPKTIAAGRIGDPQQWNAYASCGNPLRFVDPDAREIRPAAGADVDNLIRCSARMPRVSFAQC